MGERVLDKIQDAILADEYEITDPHFLEELAEDDLTLSDAKTAILARIIYEHVPQASSLQSPASTASKMLAVHARQSVATYRRFVNNAG